MSKELKFVEVAYQKYKILDNTNWKVAEIYNRDFVIKLNLFSRFNPDDLINLINTIESKRNTYEIDVQYGEYEINTTW